MKEEFFLEDLKPPQDNNSDPFRTSSIENTAAAKVSDYIWNRIMFCVLDCTCRNASAFSGGEQWDFKGFLWDILPLMALSDA